MKANALYKQPVVSVCIPVFNGAKFISECIQSVLTQSFDDIELLIVDNASTDSTIDICSAFIDRRIRIHRGVSNIGAYANFKKCFELACGEFVILLPCDDLLEPGCLAALTQPLLVNPSAGLAFGRSKVINSAGESISEPCFVESVFLNPEQALCFIADNFNPIQHPLVRKTYYFEQGGFQKKYGCFMDIHLWMKIAWSSKAIYLAPIATTCVRKHPDQGQNIVKDINANNLTGIASHFGNRSLKQHQYRTAFNLSFLRFAKSFAQLNAKNKIQTRNGAKVLTLLIKSNIIHILKAILHRNIDLLSLEMVVYQSINRQFKNKLVPWIYLKEVVLIPCRLALKLAFVRKKIIDNE